MAANTGYGQRIERGGPMGSPFGSPGTVSFDRFYGGNSGMTKAELSSVGPVAARNRVGPSGTIPGPAGGFLTLPVLLAMGVLVWYAVKNY